MLMGGRLAVVRGGGDIATGIIYRLWRCGFKVLALEISTPLVVRRTVSVASAVFSGKCTVDGMPAALVSSPEDVFSNSGVSVIVDPDGKSIAKLHPHVVVDAIMAKKNTGTTNDMAPLVIGIGPGFTAKKDVHYAVETKRGHYLGRLISDGSPIPDTGVPGMEMGYTTERLLRAPADGFLTPLAEIGDHVESGDLIAVIGEKEIRSQIRGMLRGLIHPSVYVTEGMKIGDVDPRDVREHCFTISDKAFAVAGGVLEAVMHGM